MLKKHEQKRRKTRCFAFLILPLKSVAGNYQDEAFLQDAPSAQGAVFGSLEAVPAVPSTPESRSEAERW